MTFSKKRKDGERPRPPSLPLHPCCEYLKKNKNIGNNLLFKSFFAMNPNFVTDIACNRFVVIVVVDFMHFSIADSILGAESSPNNNKDTISIK